ncbi:MAG: phosphoglycerate kinase [Patescibacteria group bacterium]
MESNVYKKEKLAGKTILLRVDFNVEIKNNSVQSDFRLRRTLPTIKDIQAAGAKIILIAHIDDKEGGSLEPVARYLLPHFPKLYFVKDIFADDAKNTVARMNNGDVVMFENLRKWPGEKTNDPVFSAHLASFGDIYINEAFSVSHRSHASIVGVPKILPAFIGPAFGEEVRHLSKVFHPERPFFFVIGGAKFETKLPLVQKFLKLADQVAVMGALANDFFKDQGLFIAESDVSKEIPKEVSEMQTDPKIILPIDVVTTYKGERFQKLPSAISIGERMVDAGEKTIKALKNIVLESNFILWNGPLGKSDAGFAEGTESFARALAASKKSAIVGGGDVVAAIENLGLMEKFTFVSSGGGAMLTFLSDETLVGLDAVRVANHKVSSSKPNNPRKSLFARLAELF